MLTGQLDDGTAGLLAIKDRGGIAIVQDPAEATAPGMPLSALRHVAVDFRGTLKDIAGRLIELAKDDPPADEQPLMKLMEIEDRIAEGVFNVSDWWVLESMSKPSGFNCPDCMSALYEIDDKRILRFRCRSGHGFSPLTLLSGQSETREKIMSAIFSALIEEATLVKRMQSLSAYRQDKPLADGLLNRADVLTRQAAQVCDWLHAFTGVVEPDPLLLTNEQLKQ